MCGGKGVANTTCQPSKARRWLRPIALAEAVRALVETRSQKPASKIAVDCEPTLLLSLRLRKATPSFLKPFTREWSAYRQQRIDRAEDVRFMDGQAAEGKPWPIKANGWAASEEAKRSKPTRARIAFRACALSRGRVTPQLAGGGGSNQKAHPRGPASLCAQNWKIKPKPMPPVVTCLRVLKPISTAR